MAQCRGNKPGPYRASPHLQGTAQGPGRVYLCAHTCESPEPRNAVVRGAPPPPGLKEEVLHSPHKTNTVKIQENLVSISDFLFTLKIRPTPLQKRSLKEKAPPAEIKTHMKRQEALSCFPSESMRNHFPKRRVSTALTSMTSHERGGRPRFPRSC